MHRSDHQPDLPSLRWRAALSLLRRLPQGALSRGFGRLADAPIPPAMRPAVVGAFARAVGANVSEAELPLEAYPTLNRFFTRRLTRGARTWPADASTVASPVDGAVGQLGIIREGRLIQAKGRLYDVGQLLEDEGAASRYEGGAFITLYLSPKDYHRIHAPVGGEIRDARHVPGALLPVNAAAVAHLPELFARNERLMCHIDGPAGRTAVVAVGAYNVGRISAAFDAEWNAPVGTSAWVTNRRGLQSAARRYDPPVPVRRGDEIMTFHLGSTVVLVFEPGRVTLDRALRPGDPVRLGQPIAHPAPR
ncbi:MAG TPA: archaetidylserine decarboxylase [Longimicrobium sp.]|jgi:phosphatidylserine decarboxylase|uniref:archaetidylserine decarboxylase n=1 Tax=Longimicrobium sp. TaxID=2029185 RepID=UPI002EDA00E3